MPPSFGNSLDGPGTPLFQWSSPARQQSARRRQVAPPGGGQRQAAPPQEHRGQMAPPEELSAQDAPPAMMQERNVAPEQAEPPAMEQEGIEEAAPPAQMEAPAQRDPSEVEMEVPPGQVEEETQPGQNGPSGESTSAPEPPRSGVEVLLREAEERREAALSRQREWLQQPAGRKRRAGPALEELVQRSAKAKPTNAPAAIYGVAALLQLQIAATRKNEPSEQMSQAVRKHKVPTVPPMGRVSASFIRAMENLRKQVRNPQVRVRSRPLTFVDRKLLERDVLAGVLQAHFCFRRRLRQGRAWRCINLRCFCFRGIYLHIKECQDNNCRFKPCGPSKRVLEHFNLCVTKVCLVCGPYKGARPVINEPLDLSKLDFREFLTAGPIEDYILPKLQASDKENQKPVDANVPTENDATVNDTGDNAALE